MAFTRPLLSLALRKAKGVIHHPCYRQVTLSSTEVKPLTISQARKCLMDMVGTFYKAEEGGVFVIRKEENMLPIKSHQEECPVRHMKDSYQEVIIPLGHDPLVRDKYLSFVRGLRFGRLLEDLDTFAVWICYIHNQNPNKGQFLKSPLSTVTALVDRIDLHNLAISPYKDVKMCGHVTWVGKSSMEVTMTVEQEADGDMQQMLTARFVMVARNPETGEAAVVNPLLPDGEQEWAMFYLGERMWGMELQQEGQGLKQLSHQSQASARCWHPLLSSLHCLLGHTSYFYQRQQSQTAKAGGLPT
ncbi:acyl-coenzyme A thioesterase 9, mitochondrial-like [Babylonia areolata]|uniref:acyl-coenzyme A thioesterase 9, mitochondrial-like n=1 Tax=Babylonia areolata TaxID=304850 RepID=UPI003FD21212